MEGNQRTTTRERPLVWLGTLFVVVLLATLAIWRAAREAGTMSAAAANDANAAAVKPGEVTKIVMEIAETPTDGKIRGILLAKRTDEVYSRTRTQVTVSYAAETKFVMGKAADVRAGAVVHVTGVSQKDHSLEAQQIVILTGYVKIE